VLQAAEASLVNPFDPDLSCPLPSSEQIIPSISGVLVAMAVADVLRMLVNSDHKVSDALRAAMLLPEVIGDKQLLAWLNDELSGYPDTPDSDVPSYRRHRFAVHGNASNGAWFHRDSVVPIHSFTDKRIREYGSRELVMKQPVGGIEEVLSGSAGNPGIPFPAPIVGLMNRQIADGNAAIDDTYGYTEVWFEVPRNLLHQVLVSIRQRALTEIAKRTPLDELEAKISRELPTAPGTFTVQGSGNQVIVASPGASATLHIPAGDRVALDEGLASMGIDPERIAELHQLVDDPAADDESRVMRALAWSRETAKLLGINTLASGAATVALHYLGQL
jgi:hypothetical protein